MRKRIVSVNQAIFIQITSCFLNIAVQNTQPVQKTKTEAFNLNIKAEMNSSHEMVFLEKIISETLNE